MANLIEQSERVSPAAEVELVANFHPEAINNGFGFCLSPARSQSRLDFGRSFRRGRNSLRIRRLGQLSSDDDDFWNSSY